MNTPKHTSKWFAAKLKKDKEEIERMKQIIVSCNERKRYAETRITELESKYDFLCK